MNVWTRLQRLGLRARQPITVPPVIKAAPLAAVAATTRPTPALLLSPGRNETPNGLAAPASMCAHDWEQKMPWWLGRCRLCGAWGLYAETVAPDAETLTIAPSSALTSPRQESLDSALLPTSAPSGSDPNGEWIAPNVYVRRPILRFVRGKGVRR